MKWLKTTVTYESSDTETAVALISEIFQAFGVKGVVEESPVTDAGVDWAEDAVATTANYGVTGFFPEKYHGKKQRETFQKLISELQPAIISSFTLSYDEVDEEDWAESWKLHFHPFKVTDRIVVCPSWRSYAARKDEIIIELDPGMAFGTGTHPTTALCIRLVEQFMTREMRFLDIGTGSGILMITAAKLGAIKPAGIDSDPVALEVAESNLLRNNIPADGFSLAEGDLVDTVDRPFDMIVANILAEIICNLVPDIPPILAPNGILIVSGIIVDKEAMVLTKLHAFGFKIIETHHLEGWSAICCTRFI